VAIKPKTDESRLFCSNFAVCIILGHYGSLVISFPINRTPRAGGEVSTQSYLSHPLGFRSSFC
jgi:hypothetical protein